MEYRGQNPADKWAEGQGFQLAGFRWIVHNVNSATFRAAKTLAQERAVIAAVSRVNHREIEKKRT
jgi:hypothetical protein